MFEFSLWQLLLLIIAFWVLGFMSGVGGREDWARLSRMLRYWRKG